MKSIRTQLNPYWDSTFIYYTNQQLYWLWGIIARGNWYISLDDHFFYTEDMEKRTLGETLYA